MVEAEARGSFVVDGIFDGGEEGGINAEICLIVDIFVSEGDGEDSLGDHVCLLMGDEQGVSWIIDDLIDAGDESDWVLAPLQEDGAGVGGEPSAVEMDVDFLGAGRRGCRKRGRHGTLCLVVGWEKCVAIPLQLV